MKGKEVDGALRQLMQSVSSLSLTSALYHLRALQLLGSEKSSCFSKENSKMLNLMVKFQFGKKPKNFSNLGMKY